MDIVLHEGSRRDLRIGHLLHVSSHLQLAFSSLQLLLRGAPYHELLILGLFLSRLHVNVLIDHVFDVRKLLLVESVIFCRILADSVTSMSQ